MGALMLRAIVALAVLLVPLVAHADDVDALHSAYVFWQRAPDPDALRCPFAENAYCPIPGVTITTTRASPCMSYDGTKWHTQPANTACVGRFGLETFGSLTNQWTFSNDATQWNQEATPIVTPQPDGSFLVEDDNAGAFEGLRSPSVAAAAGETWTVTCEVKRATASTFRLAVEAANPCTLLSVPTEWTRVSCTRTLTGSTARGAFYPADNDAGDTGGTYVRQCQLEKSPTPGPRHDCAGSPCTRAADVHTVSTAGWPVESGEIRLQYTPASATAVDENYLLDTRGVGGSGGLTIRRSSDDRIVILVNGVGSIQTSPQTWIGTTEIAVRWDEDSLTIRRDGVSLVTSPLSSSVQPHGAIAYVGSLRGGGAFYAHGSIRLLRVSQ